MSGQPEKISTDRPRATQVICVLQGKCPPIVNDAFAGMAINLNSLLNVRSEWREAIAKIYGHPEVRLMNVRQDRLIIWTKELTPLRAQVFDQFVTSTMESAMHTPHDAEPVSVERSQAPRPRHYGSSSTNSDPGSFGRFGPSVAAMQTGDHALVAKIMHYRASEYPVPRSSE